MLTLDRRLVGNRLLDDIAIGPEGGRAAVMPDQSHPFFYDHPLDHVPGLLLIESACQIAHSWARRSGVATGPLCGFSVRFRQFFRHGAPIRLVLQTITDAPVTTIGVAIRQDGGAAADVTLRLGQPGADQTTLQPPHWCADLPLDPAPGLRLNKSDPVNVMIGHPVATATGHAARLLAPEPGNLLGDGHPAWHHPLYLLEGFMQLLRFRNSERPADAPRMRDILAGIDVEIAAPVGRDMPAALYCAADQRATARFLIREGQVLAAGDTAMRVSVLTYRPTARPVPEPAVARHLWTLPVGGAPVPVPVP